MRTITLPCCDNLTQRIIRRKRVANINDAMKMVWHDLIMEDLHTAASLLCCLCRSLSECLSHIFTQGRWLNRCRIWAIAHKRAKDTPALCRRHRNQIDACRSIVMPLHPPQPVMFDRCFFHYSIIFVFVPFRPVQRTSVRCSRPLRCRSAHFSAMRVYLNMLKGSLSALRYNNA